MGQTFRYSAKQVFRAVLTSRIPSIDFRMQRSFYICSWSAVNDNKPSRPCIVTSMAFKVFVLAFLHVCILRISRIQNA